MLRAPICAALILGFAAPAAADIEVATLLTGGSSGLGGALELGYSPQGFWAVGLRGSGDGAALLPEAFGRLSLDVLKTVPRLDLSFGYAANALSWGVNMGVDHFFSRRWALRLNGGFGSASGWIARAGAAWFPLD
jgi:hypothetical protein